MVLPAVPAARGPARGAGTDSAQKRGWADPVRPGRKAPVNCACSGRKSRAFRSRQGGLLCGLLARRGLYRKVKATSNASASFHCTSSVRLFLPAPVSVTGLPQEFLQPGSQRARLRLSAPCDVGDAPSPSGCEIASERRQSAIFKKGNITDSVQLT